MYGISGVSRLLPWSYALSRYHFTPHPRVLGWRSNVHVMCDEVSIHELRAEERLPLAADPETIRAEISELVRQSVLERAPISDIAERLNRLSERYARLTPIPRPTPPTRLS